MYFISLFATGHTDANAEKTVQYMHVSENIKTPQNCWAKDGVSGVHEINTIYKDGGLLGKFFLTV